MESRFNELKYSEKSYFGKEPRYAVNYGILIKHPENKKVKKPYGIFFKKPFFLFSLVGFFHKFASKKTMVLLKSLPPEIGRPLPQFTLKDVFGKTFRSSDFQGKVLVVMFLCGHCPYVQAVEDRILELARTMKARNVDFVAINPNDWTLNPEKYQEDSPEELRKRVVEKQYTFPYLLDETQEVAKKFDAVCTPEFFVYDENRKLYYHGRLDDNWKNPEHVTRQELKEAIEKALHGEHPPIEQNPSMGCSIKWKEN